MVSNGQATRRVERTGGSRFAQCVFVSQQRLPPGGEGARYHLLGCSVFDNAWLDTVSARRRRPFLFLAEGVSMYLEEAQVKWLVLTLRD